MKKWIFARYYYLKTLYYYDRINYEYIIIKNMVKPDDFWTLVIEKPTITPSRQRKLDTLQDYLRDNWEFTNDPIEFIRIHYQWDKEKWILEKSINQLWDFLKDKWINYATSDGLHKFLTDLWFSFRKHSEKTKIGWNNSANNEYNSALVSDNLTRFQSALVSIWENWNINYWNVFSLEIYSKIKFPIDKAFYLLNINPQDIKNIANITTLGKKALTQCINLLLSEKKKIIEQELWVSIEIPNIQDGSIWNLLKKFN